MPLSAKNNLDDLYAKHRLLQDEASRLEQRLDELEADGSDPERRYILDIEAQALREEATKLSAVISDILDRDLQR
jgi:predicted nuclease with TOPRIM domain